MASNSTILFEDYRGFLQFLQSTVGFFISNRPRLLPAKSFPVDHSSVILTQNAKEPRYWQVNCVGCNSYVGRLRAPLCLLGRRWEASVTRVEGIEKETASESMRTGPQCCALINMKNYFVSRDWTPKTCEEGNHWRVVYILGVEEGEPEEEWKHS